MARCTITHDESTGVWLGALSLNGKVIAFTKAWSRGGVVSQLTLIIRSKA